MEMQKKKWKKRRNIFKRNSEMKWVCQGRPNVGSGNTNDGNTARRFFTNSELSAAITGIDKRIIIRFRVILQTISSNYAIKEDKFEEYCKETDKLHVTLYPWYMPTTIHKILIHGPEVVKSALILIGMLSEEALTKDILCIPQKESIDEVESDSDEEYSTDSSDSD